MNKVFLSGGFIVQENLVLLGKRAENKSQSAGLWDIFGGHSIKNENPPDTLCRELKEELNITPVTYELFTTINLSEEEPFFYHIFFVTLWTGKPEIMNDEHIEIKWYSFEEIKYLELAAPEYVSLVRLWQNSKR